MKQFLVLVSSNKIPNYLAHAIEKLAELEDSIVWVGNDSRMHIIQEQKWNFLETFISKRYPVFRENPLGEKDLDELIKENKNVFKRIDSDQGGIDWILLEDSKIELDQHIKPKYAYLALDISLERIIEEVLSKKSITISYLVKTSIEENWNLCTRHIGIEQGLKNTWDKALWNFSVFLPSIIHQEIKSNHTEEILRVGKSKVSIQKKVIAYQIKLLFKILKRKLNTKEYNWKIAFEKEGQLLFLKQPSKSFWADPFFLEHNGLKVVFFEELDHKGKGRIAAIKLDDNFEIIEKQVVIEEGFHLSFPNVFIQNNQVLMIPESSESNKVLLYQCDEFPFKWSLKKTILNNIKLIDMVWTKQENTFWIFANKIEDFEYENNERLYLYSTLDLTSGKWQAHPLNPIVCNIKMARNAGKIICQNGKLFRVGQNGLVNYGASLCFNEIKIISKTEYLEKPFKVIIPEKKHCGQHTWNEAYNGFAVTDFLITE